MDLRKKAQNIIHFRGGTDGVAELESPPESWAVTGAAMAAGVLTRKAMVAGWTKFRGNEPPLNPAAPGVSWANALSWAIAMGAAMGVSHVLARRSVSAAAREYYL